jgi:hypothetical protein
LMMAGAIIIGIQEIRQGRGSLRNNALLQAA